MLKFTHSGMMGDIFSSLWFVKDVLNATNNETCSFNIQINVPEKQVENHPNGKVRLTEKAAQFIKPLLQKCDFISAVTISETVPEKSVNLDDFRKFPLNLCGSDLREYYYVTSMNILPRLFHLPVIALNETDDRFRNKVCISFSERYQPLMKDFSILKNFDCVFLGLQREYDRFCELAKFSPAFVKTQTALEVAQAVNSCRCFVSNQTGNFWIAEALKTPRILLPCDFLKSENFYVAGPTNVLPLGGVCGMARSSRQLKTMLDQIQADRKNF